LFAKKIRRGGGGRGKRAVFAVPSYRDESRSKGGWCRKCASTSTA